MIMKSSNVVWHKSTVTRQNRQEQNGHLSTILWFTGLSGAGKSTLAHTVEDALSKMNCRTFVIDGDNIRHGLCADLGFSSEDRVENIRRIGEVAKLFTEAGIIVLSAFISPFRADRDRVRELVPEGDFIEIYCQASLEVCEERDVKGLYKKARSGEIPNFTGISSPYEPPEEPEIIVKTGEDSLEVCAQQVIEFLQERGIVQPTSA
ncbi:adenylyl-sulfate kinase [Acaryochloris marina]|uniref:Adenylyl-sulfate kinase n=1 Tax=Acaryochloris marina (strain MBIC 11017) TaxID=329726 RepID=CYSC_ACAM1|nr:adenylyl-sulfate kinase [Acaryochloris marina]B0CAX3.1 RecName: Full=Adenylyl-sulfate kinase; AltName: Full=APS kinase; AltName: Full=ATP adenosine-5'-phosphosulfate 3'-phosphotransferase; AltName: Full=Adenosine-5'-phosphosulfate kinase [Acaryochloris marina MBIC11017]ABW25463.1 adenylylsulfate kinase [Acaryochloris marina MBIC11017]BDM80351.1 adenylyl-sulfate kinase [Acaryochloris marina MBIC10699]